VGLLLEGLGSPARAEQAAVALEALAGGPGELRKGAVARILALPADRLDPLQRERTLEALTGQGAADLDGWRALFEASRHESWDRAIFYHDWMKSLTAGVFGHARPIPLLTALKGLDQTLAHGGIGHGSYFRGRTLSPGRDFADGNPHPEYYAVVSAVKNPIAWLVLVLVGTVLYLGRLRGGRLSALEALALLGVPAAMFLALSMGKALLGVRYLMPIYPFLVLCAAQAFASIPRAAWALTGVALVESLWIHPHQLMYYNALVGGPGGGPAVTVVGDDWGQDARAVGEFYQRHRASIERAGGLYYRPYSPADPAAFGLDAVRAPTGRASGIVAVHQVDYYREPEEFGWLEDYEPFLMIGHAVRVYDTRPGPPGGDPLQSWAADG
jgi:hypothetical protein